jgi:peptidoglycan/LPS O-acetylase OafA/YrhL
MTEYPNLAEIEGRPARSWSVDGLQELILGVLWMMWGGSWLLGQLLPKNWMWGVYWTVVPVLLAFSGFAGNWAVKRLKERITFPRTGYVELKEPSRAVRLGTAAVAILVSGALAAMIVRSEGKGVEHMITPVVGVILSLSFLVASVKQKAPHYLVLAGVALALGIAFGALRTGWESLNWMFVVLGVIAAISGGIRLSRFVEKYGAAPKEA